MSKNQTDHAPEQPRQTPSDPAHEARYTMSVAARLAQLSPAAIRSCERAGVIAPTRSSGRQRLYSAHDVARLGRVRMLLVDMGVNMAGVEVALRLMDRIAELERQVERLRATRQNPQRGQ
ncbi:MAG: MerR family transcriptional regulator [Dehalococcoidia bacterium]|nr:MerR family transcriptional regulator [Dehalococcoidia bacterium]